MIGAIAGDIIGSVHEHHNTKLMVFHLFSRWCTFTDDTVMTVAIADAILSGEDYGTKLKEWYRLYPERGYGPGFRRWAAHNRVATRHSMGNGSAMRVSPIGFAFSTLEKVLEEAKKSAEPSHSHPEGIKGAQAVASAVFLARTGKDKDHIRQYIEDTFSYRLNRTLDEIRPRYRFDSTCPGSVPEAITAFLESEDYEDAVRKAVSLGGDSDTIACITGGIAEAFYGMPEHICIKVLGMLDDRLRMTVSAFAPFVTKLKHHT
jgi:ADP-ribosylglycohydrolase